MAVFVNDVGHFGAIDATYDSYKQAAEYAAECEEWYYRILALNNGNSVITSVKDTDSIDLEGRGTPLNPITAAIRLNPNRNAIQVDGNGVRVGVSSNSSNALTLLNGDLYVPSASQSTIPISSKSDNLVKWLAAPEEGLYVPPQGSNVVVFDTVEDMRNSNDLLKGMIVHTRGYHKPTGHGGAYYDIWDLAEYRTSIDNATWVPDGEESPIINGKTHYAGGNHTLQNGLVAILQFTKLWAGQAGLEDPVDDEDDYVARGVNHQWGLQKAADFAKLSLSTNLSDKAVTNPNTGLKGAQEGRNVRRNRILHIEQGNYVITKTFWVPANIWLCGGADWGMAPCVNIIPLKPHLGGKLSVHKDDPTGPVDPVTKSQYVPSPFSPLPDDYTYVRDYMIIFNGNRHLDQSGGANVPWGATPAESIYISPYVGGMSAIDLNNYETDYEKLPSGKSDWYKPNYLKGIKGVMCFGSFWGLNFGAERLYNIVQRPGIDYADFYADAFVIDSMKTNAPIDEEYFSNIDEDKGINNDYLLDFNGSGDCIRIEGCQFPVNHPPKNPGPDTMWPDGEYKFGEVHGQMSRSVRLQNTALFDPTAINSSGYYSGAGMQIKRNINGRYLIRGYRNVHIDSCHLEYGQVICDAGSVLITNTYFSKVKEAHYNSVECRKGSYGGTGHYLKLDGCMFHYGFDGTHLPPMQEDGYYDVVVNNTYNVEFNNCAQEWDSATSPELIALQVGMWSDVDETTIEPVKGWDRWGMYLSENGRINKGKIVPARKYFFWNGFEGVQDVRISKMNTPEMWTKGPGTFYYYAQLLFDPLDETVDPSIIPLGKDQRDRKVLDANGQPTTERYEATAVVPPPGPLVTDPSGGAPFMQLYRPILNFYSEQDTPDTGMVRLYRGTEKYRYTEYVDIPMMARAACEDYGDKVYGRKWKPMPASLPPDPEPDEDKRKRNIFPTTGELLKEYQVYMSGGNPTTDSVDMKASDDYYGRAGKLYYGTGYWESSKSRKVTIAGNRHTQGPAVGYNETTVIFNRPFIHFDPPTGPGQVPNYEIYCALPSTGLLDWQGKPMVFNKGDIVHIVRTKETLLKVNEQTLKPILDANGKEQYWPKTILGYTGANRNQARPLYIQAVKLDPAGGYELDDQGNPVIDPNNGLPTPKTIKTLLRNMGGDEILTCIYDEIDVMVTDPTTPGDPSTATYRKEGNWVVVNGGSLDDYVSPLSYYQFTATTANYTEVMPNNREDTFVSFDYAWDDNQGAGKGPVGIWTKKNTKLGSRMHIYRGKSFNATVVIQIKNLDDKGDPTDTFQQINLPPLPSSVVTLVKMDESATGWKVVETTRPDVVNPLPVIHDTAPNGVAMDVTKASVFTFDGMSNAAGDFTFSFTNLPTTGALEWRVVFLEKVTAKISWSNNIQWNLNTVPGGGKAVYHFFYDGSTIYGRAEFSIP